MSPYRYWSASMAPKRERNGPQVMLPKTRTTGRPRNWARETFSFLP